MKCYYSVELLQIFINLFLILAKNNYICTRNYYSMHLILNCKNPNEFLRIEK